MKGNKMKKLLLSAIFALSTTSAMAEYTMVVPQQPGGGTSVWAEIVARELEKFLGEDIVIQHIPGARDIPGFDEFHNSLQFDEKTIMVSHGGNGISFLQEQVDYNYAEYESVGLMNLNIIAGKRIGDDMTQVRFAAGSGMTPEAMAMTMLLCGPDMSVDQYIKCFGENVIWVNGMSGGERRLAFKRGELNGSRENPAAYKKHIASDENAEVWFHHGLLQADGSHADDPNYPGYQFEILFEQQWGVAPNGDFYNAYKLAKSFRDGLQKALWVSSNNPNLETLRNALEQMVNNPESRSAIEQDVGKYEWLVGEEGNALRDTLFDMISEQALRDLVKFNEEALGLASVYKENLIQ
jgi:hypothetical protein